MALSCEFSHKIYQSLALKVFLHTTSFNNPLVTGASIQDLLMKVSFVERKSWTKFDIGILAPAPKIV